MNNPHPNALRRAPHFSVFLSHLIRLMAVAGSRFVQILRNPQKPYISDRIARDIGMSSTELAKRQIKWPSQHIRW